jgi:hypothetical protein
VGLPGSFAARREACIDEAGARGDPRRAEFEGGIKSKRGNKFDIQTTVQDSQLYMLYR